VAAVLPAAYRLLGYLPDPLRRFVIGRFSPAHRVGTTAIVRDGPRILLARHTYRKGWTLPGGMLGWNEHPGETIVREMREEAGLATVAVGEPFVYVVRRPRWLEFVYELDLAEGVVAADARAASPEIAEVAWFVDPDETVGLMDRRAAELLAWVDEMNEARRGAGGTLTDGRAVGEADPGA